MKAKYFRNAAVCLGTMAMMAGSAVLAQAATGTATNMEDAHKAARLLRDVRADAVQVRSAAARLDRLTQSSNAKWLDYDRQWNEIKPSVEDMQMKLWNIEAMQTQISPREHKELAQSKVLIQEIQARTRELRNLLDKPGVQTSDVQFRAFAKRLRNEAGRLEKTA